MATDNLFVVPSGAIPGTPEISPADPHFRWNGQRTDGDKSPEAAQRARAGLFATIEEFAAWRRSKGMPDLTMCDLMWAFARYKGEPVNETAKLNPILEKRDR